MKSIQGQIPNYHRKRIFKNSHKYLSYFISLFLLIATIVAPALAANETLYDNAFVSPWVNGSYNVSVNANATATGGDGNVLQVDYSGGYGALNIIDTAGNNNASDFTKLEFDIYAPNAAANNQIQVFLKGNSTSAKILINIPNTTDWHHIELDIPGTLSGLSSFNQIQFQTISNSSFTVYYDNIQLSDGSSSSSSGPGPATTASDIAPAYYYDNETGYVIENAMDTVDGGMFIALDPATNDPFGPINMAVFGLNGIQGTDKNGMGHAVCARYYVQEYQRITTTGQGVIGINQVLSDMGSSITLTDSSQLLTDYAAMCADFIIDNMVIPADDSITGGTETCATDGLCEADADQGDTGIPNMHYYWASTGKDGSDRLIDDSLVDPNLAAARPESSISWSLAELALAFKEANGGVCDANCQTYRDAAIEYWNWRYTDAVATPSYASTNTQVGVARDLFYAPLGFILTEITGDASYRDGGAPACPTTNNGDGAPCGAVPFLNNYLGTGSAPNLSYPASHAIQDGNYVAGYARAIAFALDSATDPSDLSGRDQWWDFGWFTVINDQTLSVMGPTQLLATRTDIDMSKPFAHFSGREALAGSQRAAMFYATFGVNPSTNWPTYNASAQSQENFTDVTVEHWEYMIEHLWDDAAGQRSWYESTSHSFKPCFSAGTEIPFADYMPPTINDLSHTTVSDPALPDEAITFEVDVTEEAYDYMSWAFAASGVNSVEVLYTCDISVASSGDPTLFESVFLSGDGTNYAITLDGATVDAICDVTDKLYYYTRIIDNFGNKSTFSQPGNTGSAIAPEEKVDADDWWYQDAAPLTNDQADLQVVPFSGASTTVQIGNFIWLDDGDGVQESGEAGIDGVTVTLYATDGTVVATTTTSASGFYTFSEADGVVAGTDYVIGVNPNELVLDGYALVLSDAGAPNDDEVDSDGGAGSGLFAGLVIINVTAPNAGLADMSFDIGFVLETSMGLYDWGDLPDSKTTSLSDHYPTNSQDDFGEGIGASHEIIADMFLGSCVDAELNGQPSLEQLADQDDGNGVAGDAFGTCATEGDDEDGIVFTTPLIAGQQACVDITVSAVAADGVVNGWIDFNSNGVLDDAGEQVFTNLDVGAGAGTYEHCFAVPSVVIHGDVLYSRFRLSDDGLTPDDASPLAPVGFADTGEVEDYALALGCVGNYVWLDAGLTGGVQDSKDAPFPNMSVVLTWGGADGLMGTSADNVTYTTITDSAGEYYFCGLLEDPTGDGADAYQISIDIANTPLTMVTQDSGSDDALDSEANASGVVPAFTLALPNSATDSASNDVDPVGYADSATDLSMDIGVTTERIELGDLPNGVANMPDYNTVFGNGPATAHILFPDDDNDFIPEPIAGVHPVWGGDIVDDENDGQPAGATNGDDADGTDDEDGLDVPTFTGVGSDYWNHNDSQDFVVTAASTAPNEMAEYGLWIDWNEDGDFTDLHEFYSGTIVTGATANGDGIYQGQATVSVTMPSVYNLGLDTAFMRLRIFASGSALAPLSADAVTAVSVGGFEGVVMNGEVEDYSAIFPAAPTAVSLQDGGAAAQNSASLMMMLLGAIAVLFVTGAGLFARFRRG